MNCPFDIRNEVEESQSRTSSFIGRARKIFFLLAILSSMAERAPVVS